MISAVEKLRLSMSPKLCVAVLTGAGVSIESGVPIFRGRGSMWGIPQARWLASRAGPPWDTAETWEFYEWRRRLVSNCQPNAAHKSLVQMERYFEDFSLITQNVDGLHRRAGSRNILKLHGNMWKGRCTNCERVVELPDTPLQMLPPRCGCGYALRPHVVQFGEPIDPKVLSQALAASKKAQLFLLVGTSGVVSPASQMPLLAIENRAKVIEINPNPTVLTPCVSLSIRGKAADILPRLWEEIRIRSGAA